MRSVRARQESAVAVLRRGSAQDVLRIAGGALLAIAGSLAYIRMEDSAWAEFSLLILVAVPWFVLLGLALSRPVTVGEAPWRVAYLGIAALLTPLTAHGVCTTRNELQHITGLRRDGRRRIHQRRRAIRRREAVLN